MPSLLDDVDRHLAAQHPARSCGGPDLRGNTNDRRRRREWLVEAFRANVDLGTVRPGEAWCYRTVPVGHGVPACRCYRCGVLLTVDTVTADRILPGMLGGRYTRDNIRPACATCNSTTGAELRHRLGIPDPNEDT